MTARGRSEHHEVLRPPANRGAIGNAAIERDEPRLRPSELPDLVGDARRAQAQTGWQPAIPLAQTLLDLLNYERARVADSVAAGSR